MTSSRQESPKYLRIIETLYLGMIGLSFYLLVISRAGEAHTIWEVLNPFFLPALFITTFLLLTILSTSEKVTNKLLLVIAHSILIHSFFAIIFPAGDMSGQQTIIGRSRLVFDNVVYNGWMPWPKMPLQLRVFEWFRGITFQSALSVIFARMLNVDLLWVHLSLIPVLWGVFIPFAVFLTAKLLSRNEGAAILSSLLISTFPYATYFGAISVPDSLGFIFFVCSLYFMLKNLESDNSKTKGLMLVFIFFTFISHFMIGIISFAILLFVLTFKSVRSKSSQQIAAKASLAISFLLGVSLLPMSFIYLRFINTAFNASFTLNKFFQLPMEEIVGLSFLGDLIYSFDLRIVLVFIAGPIIALLWMIYFLLNSKSNAKPELRGHSLLLLSAFMMILIDYIILKVFMTDLPLNPERLWMLQDFIAVPFLALAIWGALSSVRGFLEKRFHFGISNARVIKLSKSSIFHALPLMLALNIMIPTLLTGWITFSLSTAYPQVSPLQTTSYELEAAKYIEDNTHEKYVVIGDQWTIFAGEVIVGVNNPRAYYFLEYNRTGISLFLSMKQDPNPQTMLLAMNYTDTTVAYFIVTEPRLGTQEFNNIVSKAQGVLTVFHVTGEGKLYVFSYEKG